LDYLRHFTGLGRDVCVHIPHRIADAAVLHGNIGARGVIEKTAIALGRRNVFGQRSHHDCVRGLAGAPGEFLQFGLEGRGQFDAGTHSSPSLQTRTFSPLRRACVFANADALAKVENRVCAILIANVRVQARAASCASPATRC
jgi:hypothetical protein